MLCQFTGLMGTIEHLAAMYAQECMLEFRMKRAAFIAAAIAVGFPVSGGVPTALAPRCRRPLAVLRRVFGTIGTKAALWSRTR